MQMVSLIEKKRNGHSISQNEIQWMIDEYTAGLIPDYQMSAMLMAIYFQGMTPDEMLAMTQTMIHSGKSMNLSSIPGIKVDKHSTGGVGDKVSLILAPLVAACDVPVPMMAGRGLGHTGGTLDKLEAIPGFKTRLPETEFLQGLQSNGFSIIGQTQDIAPADGLLYALRDVTGTVPSIPLICSSILSKKKAEGTDALVLDVKVGQGAFLPTREQTVDLAQNLVRLGNQLGMKTVALLTNMDQPLGKTIGNWLETKESIETLQGRGPEDLWKVTEALGSLMLMLGGKTESFSAGKEKINSILQSGEGLNRFIKMSALQGGDVSVLENPSKYPQSKFQVDVLSKSSGTISAIQAKEMGLLAMKLGAGREKKEDVIDPKAGIVLNKKAGDSVTAGDVLGTLYSDKGISDDLSRKMTDCYSITPDMKHVDIPDMLDCYIDENGKVLSVQELD